MIQSGFPASFGIENRGHTVQLAQDGHYLLNLIRIPHIDMRDLMVRDHKGITAAGIE